MGQLPVGLLTTAQTSTVAPSLSVTRYIDLSRPIVTPVVRSHGTLSHYYVHMVIFWIQTIIVCDVNIGWLCADTDPAILVSVLQYQCEGLPHCLHSHIIHNTHSCTRSGSTCLEAQSPGYTSIVTSSNCKHTQNEDTKVCEEKTEKISFSSSS